MNTAGQQLCTCPYCHGTGRVVDFSQQLMRAQMPATSTQPSTSAVVTCSGCGGTGHMWVKGWWAR